MAAEGPRRHKSYPVVDADGNVVGMVSRADVLRWIARRLERRRHARRRAAADELFVAYADELVGHLADRMAAADIGRVPVLDGQRANS